MRTFPRPVHPPLLAWLRAEGSLTARLRAHGRVEVVVLQQGTQSLWPRERADLNTRSGHVREVMLLLNGLPAVWARSATPHRARQGPWKALANLGNRPLAELLFQRRHIQRDQLQPHRLTRRGQITGRIRQSWNKLHGATPASPLPRWARSSVFWRQGQPLRVLEALAPWTTQLPLR
ncbi:chorismate lyase [Rhodoferax sp.]|uniref:chorismate--pyruvate lyase family protein n=1 Tax=Rhodoferax sp. TaxID=50421 RepID=UPI0026188987|nr:chorismate lyase [Rhodoferax sp.]MDD2925410.1 chorismate lyase [Rhodoferax sp.]